MGKLESCILSLMYNNWSNMQHTNISFVNNIAVRDGAAIYAYDISVCNFTADMCPDDDLTQYNHSIFAESPPFLFK